MSDLSPSAMSPFEEARAVDQLIDHVADTGAHYMIERNGKAAVVVIPYDDYEQLKEDAILVRTPPLSVHGTSSGLFAGES